MSIYKLVSDLSDEGPAMAKILIDGVEYDTETMSQEARSTLASVQFVAQQMQQKKHELNIAKTAQAAYADALKKELAKTAAIAAEKGVN